MTAGRITTAGLFIGVMACSGGGEQAPADTPATPPSTSAPTAAGFDPATITPQMIALGDSIFHGLVAVGTCQSCHGEDATGPTGVAPNLTDSEWLNGDGSWEFIYNTVMTGVMAPKKFPGLMLPMGGSGLTQDQVRAVSAYVYSLSHKSG
ncbi:MAG TPA: c-type cytochrome [Gemmatimonadaceae bacterium]|jgi:mono/diheme cytochrome c family protein